MMRNLGAVLLAAGCSSRFGDGNKLVAEIDERPVVRVVADAVLGASCIEEVIVVTGYEDEVIERVLEGLPVRFIFNTNWREGLGGSIARGISNLAAPLVGAAIVPGDMPFLTSSVIERLGAEFQERNGASIIFPATLAGEQRNPVIWPRRYFGLLENLGGPEGGKRLLLELADSSVAVPLADEKALLDIDVPGDMPDGIVGG